MFGCCNKTSWYIHKKLVCVMENFDANLKWGIIKKFVYENYDHPCVTLVPAEYRAGA